MNGSSAQQTDSVDQKDGHGVVPVWLLRRITLGEPGNEKNERRASALRGNECEHYRGISSQGHAPRCAASLHSLPRRTGALRSSASQKNPGRVGSARVCRGDVGSFDGKRGLFRNDLDGPSSSVQCLQLWPLLFWGFASPEPVEKASLFRQVPLASALFPTRSPELHSGVFSSSPDRRRVDPRSRTLVNFMQSSCQNESTSSQPAHKHLS